MSHLIIHYCAKQKSDKGYWYKRKNGWILTSAKYRKKHSVLLHECSIIELWTCIWKLEPQISDVIVIQNDRCVHAYYYDEIWDDVGCRGEMLEVPEFFGQPPLFQSEQEWIAFEEQKEAEEFSNMEKEMNTDKLKIDHKLLSQQLDHCIEELKKDSELKL